MDDPTRVVSRPSPGGKRSNVPPPKPQVSYSARKQGVVDLFDVALIPLAGLAAVDTAKNPDDVSVYALDIIAIERHKEPIADAIVELSNSYPVLGAVLDKIAVSTPIAALLASVMTLGLQIAENHRLMPDNARSAMEGMGVIPRDILEDDLKKHAAHLGSNGNGS